MNTDLELRDDLLPVPGTGELVNLADPQAVARALDALREHRRVVREVEDALTERLRDERAIQGARELLYDGLRVKFGSDSETVYDAELLEEGLRSAGMREQRIDEIIETRVERKVRAVEAKKAAAVNPAYREAVERAATVHPKRQTVTVEVAR